MELPATNLSKELMSKTDSNFEDVLKKMNDIYKAKNADYGNSFEHSLYEFGLIAAVIRMNDKMNRIKSLIKSDAKVKEESIKDTLLDLANYSAMTLAWLNK